MANVEKHIYYRDRRDRLIDLLSLGETRPLRDLPVRADGLIAATGATAGIPIDGSQRDCTYALYEREIDQAVPGAAAEPGNGEGIVLESPPISKDISHRIRSTRQGGSPECWVYLRELADIKIGINAKLQATIVNGTLLDPSFGDPKAQETRLVPYGTKVEVAIKFSQKDVGYRLVRDEDGATLSESDGTGNHFTIVLTTAPMSGDTKIRILMLQTIAGQPKPEEILADVLLQVIVAANLSSPVFAEGTHILDYAAGAIIVIKNTQTDMSYQLYGKRLDATDFVPAPGDPTVQVAGAAADVYTVKRPADAPTWEVLPGFASLSEPIKGNGADLKIPVGTFEEDTLIRVKAVKSKPGHEDAAISAPLQEVVVLLVRPNPAPALLFQVRWTNGATSGALRMTGGQRGVSYYFSTSSGGAALGSGGYFFDRYGTSPETNVGVGLLTIGRDFVVARDPWTDLWSPQLRGIESTAIEVDLTAAGEPEGSDNLSAEQRATLVPEPPIVDLGPLAGETTLYGRAVKPRTALSAALTYTATIASMPAIGVQVSSMVTAAPKSVTVAASQVGETYSVRVNGIPGGSPQAGDGGTLTFTLAKPLVVCPVLEVTARRGDAPAIVVEQSVRFLVVPQKYMARKPRPPT